MTDMVKKFMEHASKDMEGRWTCHLNGSIIRIEMRGDEPLVNCDDVEKATGVKSIVWKANALPGELERIKVDRGIYYRSEMHARMPCVERVMRSSRGDNARGLLELMGVTLDPISEEKPDPTDDSGFRMIKEFPGYAASKNGAVWSIKSGEWNQIGQRINADGYFVVTMKANGKNVKNLVHRMVLMAFVGPPEPHQETLHRNGIKNDNRLENLRWGTSMENSEDMRIHRRSKISQN